MVIRKVSLRGIGRGRDLRLCLCWLAPKYLGLRVGGNDKSWRLNGLGNGRDLVVFYEIILAEEVNGT